MIKKIKTFNCLTAVINSLQLFSGQGTKSPPTPHRPPSPTSPDELFNVKLGLNCQVKNYPVGKKNVDGFLKCLNLWNKLWENGVIQYNILGPTYSIIATHPEFASPPPPVEDFHSF